MKLITRTFILTALVYWGLFAYPACAKSKAANVQAKAKLQQAALFKNGLGFFVSEVTIPKKSDSFSIVPFGAASHGTFWVSYPPKVKVESLIVKEIELDEKVEAITISELLGANVGSKVRLWFSDKEDSIIEGTIKYFAKERERPKPNPYAPGGERIFIDNRGWRPNQVQPRLMIVDTDVGQMCIDPASVRRVEFAEQKVTKTFTSKNKSMRLDVKMGAPAGGKKLTVSYLVKGITWAPSYIVDITEGDKARISAKAVVVNEVCELDDVTIQLITGFPNLKFANIVSPLALKENLAQFLQSLTRGESARGRAGVTANVMMQVSSPVMEGEMMPAYGTAEEGKVAEDLFFYPIEKVHLTKGEVGYLPLFSESVDYKHIYKWKIPDYINEESYRSYRQRQGQDDEPDQEVWHCLRLENSGKVPWTTAPAEIVKEGLILGQDTLNYTPVQDETTLRITRAVSVKAEQVEVETKRTRDAAQFYGYHYDLVKVEGKLSVTNFQGKAIELEITKTLSGEVKSSQPEAKIKGLARGLRKMNKVRNLTWTIELEPGEHKQIDYVYEVYVRR